MSVAVGSRLGPYELIAPIGNGGMGEVYRATDRRLRREVAIKICAERFSERFEREARTIASLNHPHICQLYDVGPNYLVMELVEGPTLAERIARGALSVEEALAIARQIAEALEAAHEKGIVHRDLKPANIKVKPDGTVKVLDFGLAKAAEEPCAADDPSTSPTQITSATRAGMILGTAAYMSPEQARGAAVDKRADVWAFGCVFYEMFTGKRAFSGKTASDALAAVIRDEPDLSRVPARVRPLLKSCFEKDPKRRLRDIGDAFALIGSDPEVRRESSRLVWALAAVAALFAAAFAALAFIHFRQKRPLQAEQIRFQIPGPEANSSFPARPYLSPNGRMIAFSARSPAGHNTVLVRSLDSLDARLLAGSNGPGVTTIFWSPDSRFVGFTDQGKLKKVAVAGGAPQAVCDVPPFVSGGAWSRNGVIVFGSLGHGLMRVSESGGAPSAVTALDASHESFHAAPAFLPDGRHFIYFRNLDGERSGLYLGSLDANPERQEFRRIAAVQVSTVQAPKTVYVPSQDPAFGYLLFVPDSRERSLIGQLFDNRRMEMTGEAVQIAEGLGDPGMFSASENGILAYRTGSNFPNTQFKWFDRTGKPLGVVGELGRNDSVALSPDGTKAAISHGLPEMDIWVYEFGNGTAQRLTFDPSSAHLQTAWSPDGSRIAFGSNRNGAYDIYLKGSTGAGSEDLLLKSNDFKFPYDWSADGRWLLYGRLTDQFDLWLLPLTGNDRKPVAYLASRFNKSQARFSPDGRFVAYASTESGKNEVYVQTFPDASGGKWAVSRGGGNQPRWRRDGKELFYISADSKMMAVDVTTAPVFRSGNPKALFAAPIFGSAATLNVTRYDVTPDGRKFLINSLVSDSAAGAVSPITVVLNWQAGLNK